MANCQIQASEQVARFNVIDGGWLSSSAVAAAAGVVARTQQTNNTYCISSAVLAGARPAPEPLLRLRDRPLALALLLAPNAL